MRLELGPQSADVRVHGAAAAHVAVAPDVMKQCFAGQHLAAFFHQGNEKSEFECGQVELASAQPHFESCPVESKGPHLELLAGIGGAGFLDEQAEPQDEFSRAERFGQVIVGTQLETGDTVLGPGFGREHDDGNPGSDLPRAQLTANILAPHLRDHQVEHHGRGQFFARQFQACQAVGSFDHDETFFAQMQSNQVENVGLVLDDQNNVFWGRFGGHATFGAR